MRAFPCIWNRAERTPASFSGRRAFCDSRRDTVCNPVSVRAIAVFKQNRTLQSVLGLGGLHSLHTSILVHIVGTLCSRFIRDDHFAYYYGHFPWALCRTSTLSVWASNYRCQNACYRTWARLWNERWWVRCQNVSGGIRQIVHYLRRYCCFVRCRAHSAGGMRTWPLPPGIRTEHSIHYALPP